MSEAPQLKAAWPVFIVADVAASLAFYTDVLGFSQMFTFGEPMEYAAITRGDVQIHLSKDYQGRRTGMGSAYSSVSGVDALYEEFTEKGATIAEAICDRPYGMRDFYISDLDGNTFGFGEALPS